MNAPLPQEFDAVILPHVPFIGHFERRLARRIAARAIGTWSGLASIMTAFGPVLGGWGTSAAAEHPVSLDW